MRRIAALATIIQLSFLMLCCPATSAASDNTRAPSKGVVISGQVSHDGRALVADDDNEWVVSNSESLQGVKGRYVSVKCRMSPATRTIHVLSILDEPSTNHPAHLGDAAFRR